MTLIVGIKCKDGAVLAADGAATYGTPLNQAQTIKQPTKKLEIVGPNTVLGVSGPIGLAQAFGHEVQALCGPGHPWASNMLLARQKLGEAFWKHSNAAWQKAEVVGRSVGAAAAAGAITQSVIAITLRDGVHLLQFNERGEPEEVTTNLPFVSIGSGQAAADPFLAFIRRLLWSDDLPTVEDGVFSALWTLRHCIEAQPGGLSDPVQIVKLTQANEKWRATEVSSAHLEEHLQWLREVEKQIKESVRGALATKPDEPIPVTA